MLTLKLSLISYLNQNQNMNKEKAKRCFNLLKRFEDLYGKGEVFFVVSPARINIIGEHIDYVEYLQSCVLPFGSKEHYMIMAFRKREDDVIRCATLANFEKKEFSMIDFKINGSLEKNKRWTNFLCQNGTPNPCWSNYIKASFCYLKNLYPEKKFKGMDFLVDSSIPIAGGASSSSALVVCSALALRKINKLQIDLNEVAESCSKAEWFCGTRGGKMDHASMCFAEKDKVLSIVFHPFSVERINMSQGYSFVTFFTTPANKGKELTAEYNERSIVSRFIIPRLLKNMDISDLPKEMTLKEYGNYFKNSFKEIKETYPVLFKKRGVNYPLKIKSRAEHHVSEIERVKKAKGVLKKAYQRQQEKDFIAENILMKELGHLLTESHKSLRDLYNVSTEEIEQVIDISLKIKGVLGARVMGGGFGGNVLVLVKKERVAFLIDKVRKEYYQKNKRKESVMISTCGEGSMLLDEDTDKRLRLMGKVNNWLDWDEEGIMRLAHKITFSKKPLKIIIIAGGKGTRAKKSGLLVPKVLAFLKDRTCIEHVISKFKEKPIVVVSPENKDEVKRALKDYSIDYVEQERALGTADAVFCALKKIQGFKGDVVVIWGKQALVQKESIAKTLFLHKALNANMSFPTTKIKNPYAPLKRDKDLFVSDSVETHLEEAMHIDFGEDNIGFFVLDSSTLFETLQKLYDDYYIKEDFKYATPKGELGFPNLMIRKLVSEDKLVFAFCFAKWFEAKGVNEKKDLEIMEQYL